MSQEPLVWFITGCSSGFGEQFVRQALARGDKVIATGRNAATKLKHLDGTGAAILDLDVSAGSEIIASKIDEAIKIYGHIDVVVNNAGYSEIGPFEEVSEERIRRSFETNFFGPLSVARAVIPHTRERKKGTLAWMGSKAGFASDGCASIYGAAKHALAGFVVALSQEMAMFGLRCVIFEPGAFKTPGITMRSLKREEGTIAAYGPFNQHVSQVLDTLYDNSKGDPEKAVARMIDVITSTGQAAGKESPVRLPVGPDGIKNLRDKAQADLKVCDEWEGVMGTTNVSE